MRSRVWEAHVAGAVGSGGPSAQLKGVEAGDVGAVPPEEVAGPELVPLQEQARGGGSRVLLGFCQGQEQVGGLHDQVAVHPLVVGGVLQCRLHLMVTSSCASRAQCAPASHSACCFVGPESCLLRLLRCAACVHTVLCHPMPGAAHTQVAMTACCRGQGSVSTSHLPALPGQLAVGQP